MVFFFCGQLPEYFTQFAEACDTMVDAANTDQKKASTMQNKFGVMKVGN